MATPMTGPTLAVWLRGVAALTLTVGVVCQFVQRTDPTPPLLYFTVDSALLAAAVLIRRLLQGPESGAWGERIHGSAVVGVVLSSLVYATVIAPSGPTGTWFGAHDDGWTNTATILLHGAAPVLVAAEFLISPCSLTSTLREATFLAVWPAAYLAAVGALCWSGAATMPYLFLRPSQFGAIGVTAAIATLYAITITLGAALPAAHRVVRRCHPSHRPSRSG
ncbi:hypothetical protein SipoB123_36455 [Streptomyces ipomoeae]|nr:hypothetical protein SipoB123_36455 [Streptomyces ipomoeae]